MVSTWMPAALAVVAAVFAASARECRVGWFAAPSVIRMMPFLDPGRPLFLRYVVAAATGSPRSVDLAELQAVDRLDDLAAGVQRCRSTFW